MSNREFVIPIGPQHPALKEPESFLFTVDGETVIDVELRIGYNHRGIEKALESRTYIQNLYLVERICGICSNAHQTAYTGAVEESGGIEIPERAKYIRVFINELERIHSHLLWLGVAAHEIGFDTFFYYVWRDREVVMDLLEDITGNRVNYAMPTVGGVRRDLSREKFSEWHKKLDLLADRTVHYMKTAAAEKTIINRTAGVGVLSKEEHIRLSAVGPTARASGVESDIRKDIPYLIYDEVPFDMITSDGCDVLANVIVRVKETLESVKICKWILDNIPDGEIRTKFGPMSRMPAGEGIYILEAARGELIHYSISDGNSSPYRHKVRAPTLANLPVVIEKLKGGYIADIPIVLASIDPCFSCTDRVTFYDEGKDQKWSWNSTELRRYGVEWYKK